MGYSRDPRPEYAVTARYSVRVPSGALGKIEFVSRDHRGKPCVRSD